MKKIYPAVLILFFSGTLYAQLPTDMNFVPKGNICAGVNYSYSAWEEYWQGEELINNGNVGTVSTQQIGAGFNVGILDRLNFIVSVPYVITHCSQGTLNGQNGFQDIYLNVKGIIAEPKLGPGKLKFVGNVGFSTPISAYLVDFAPMNIGMGTTNLLYRQMISYRFDKGFYVEGKATYTYRSNIPDIHRDFYYDQGNGYYTNEVEMFDVFDWAAVLGFSNDRFMAEASYFSSNTLGGGDIRTWDPGFPSNKMYYSTINGRFDYYFAKPKGLIITAGVGYTLAGRNVGQSAFGNIGVEYLFPVWGKKKAEAPVNNN